MLLVLSTYSCDPYEVAEPSSEPAPLLGFFAPPEPDALFARLDWPFSASPFGVVLFVLSERAFPLGLLADASLASLPVAFGAVLAPVVVASPPVATCGTSLDSRLLPVT